MTTNETLIEELIEKHISLESYEAVDGRMITMKEAKDDIMVVNVRELKKDLVSALQAKEQSVKKETLDEVLKACQIANDNMVGDDPMSICSSDFEVIKKILSNLSEK